MLQATFSILHSIGLSKYINRDMATLIAHPGETQVPKHGMYTESLMGHSETFDFLMKMRPIFHEEFGKYQHDFPGINGENLFLNTIMHSMEHHSAVRVNILDKLHVSDEFLADKELAVITQSCFTDSPKWRAYDVLFHQAPHPFYNNVYKKASRINKALADHMECCIAM